MAHTQVPQPGLQAWNLGPVPVQHSIRNQRKPGFLHRMTVKTYTEQEKDRRRLTVLHGERSWTHELARFEEDREEHRKQTAPACRVGSKSRCGVCSPGRASLGCRTS